MGVNLDTACAYAASCADSFVTDIVFQGSMSLISFSKAVTNP